MTTTTHVDGIVLTPHKILQSPFIDARAKFVMYIMRYEKPPNASSIYIVHSVVAITSDWKQGHALAGPRFYIRLLTRKKSSAKCRGGSESAVIRTSLLRSRRVGHPTQSTLDVGSHTSPKASSSCFSTPGMRREQEPNIRAEAISCKMNRKMRV